MPPPKSCNENRQYKNSGSSRASFQLVLHLSIICHWLLLHSFQAKAWEPITGVLQAPSSIVTDGQIDNSVWSFSVLGKNKEKKGITIESQELESIFKVCLVVVPNSSSLKREDQASTVRTIYLQVIYGIWAPQIKYTCIFTGFCFLFFFMLQHWCEQSGDSKFLLFLSKLLMYIGVYSLLFSISTLFDLTPPPTPSLNVVHLDPEPGLWSAMLVTFQLILNYSLICLFMLAYEL